jgi:hypothetical protein
MEQDGSLLCSQQPATDPYPKPEESNSHPYITFFKIRFNIILPPMARFPIWSFQKSESWCFINKYNVNGYCEFLIGNSSQETGHFYQQKVSNFESLQRLSR